MHCFELLPARASVASQLTNSLNVGLSDDPTAAAGGQTPRSVPSKVRTAVCIDLLDILIGSVIHPDRAGAGGALIGSMGDSVAAPPAAAHSRQALGMLLLKLRDELVKAIYVQPLPPHLLLQFQPYYQRKTTGAQPAPPPNSHRRKMQGAQLGSLTARSAAGLAAGRRLNEEKQQHHDTTAAHPGSLSHRARLLSSPRHSYPPAALGTSPSFSGGPPSCLSALLACTEWFSLIGPGVARNHALADRARIVMIPSRLYRLRQVQKRVVQAMTGKWRDLLLRWKFWEWRETTRQARLDRAMARGS